MRERMTPREWLDTAVSGVRFRPDRAASGIPQNRCC